MALYLAIDVLYLELGDEILTAPLTFSTDIAPMIRASLTPVFVDVTPPLLSYGFIIVSRLMIAVGQDDRSEGQQQSASR